MDIRPTIKSVQARLGLKVDGLAGPLTWAAIAKAVGADTNDVLASTFADPMDLSRFRKAKGLGMTDSEAFRFGDNGIGYWGRDTTSDTIPMCALPPEVITAKWGKLSSAQSKLVSVTYRDKTADCVLEDTMPHLAEITNGAGIDLNPGAAKQLGIPIGGMVKVSYHWVA